VKVGSVPTGPGAPAGKSEVTVGAEGAVSSYAKKQARDQREVTVPAVARTRQPYVVPSARRSAGTVTLVTRSAVTTSPVIAVPACGVPTGHSANSTPAASMARASSRPRLTVGCDARVPQS
jgi:hypothetical protein